MDQLNDAWAQLDGEMEGMDEYNPATDEYARGFPVPDGIYTALVVDVDKSTSRAGDPMFTWKFEVVSEGDYYAKNFPRWQNLKSATNREWLQREAYLLLGRVPKKVTEILEAYRSEIIGKKVVVQVKTKEGQTLPSIYFQKVIKD